MCLLSGCGTKPHNLYEAAESGDLASVKKFLANGANINYVYRGYCGSALLVAAEKGHLGIVKYLIDNGARVNISDETSDGILPIHLASKYGHKEVVDLLLSKGADVNATDLKGRVPLHYAAHSDENAEAVRFLIAKGGNINAKDKSGNTPLHEAVSGINITAAEELLRNGANINSKNAVGYTPLHYAVMNNRKKIVQLMLSKGGSVDMFIAAGTDDVQSLISILHNHRNAINMTDGQGYTPLHWAAMCGCTNTAQFLINQGANLNARTSSNMTPLHMSLYSYAYANNEHVRNQLEVGRMLIQAGANINIRDKFGRTPLGWAEFKGYEEFADYIKANGGV